MTEARAPSVLIIDDDEVLLLTTQALLRAEGYDVATHTGAFGGASIISEMQPDLVLLDVNMPGLSGPGLAEVIRNDPRLSDLKIFFFSSSGDDELEESVRQAGVDGYVRKGDRDQLRESVARALRT